jgi:regulator of replication initiation timing
VERVLRNRAAAQKSREIKKQQLEAIETERDQLKYKFEALSEANAKLAASNTHLLAQLKRLEEENARLRQQQQQQPPQAVTVEETLDSLFLNCYGVDPFSTVTCDEASLSTTSPCMTHQPAELVCFDLPCLPGTTATTTMSMTSLQLTTLVMSLACFILTLITSLITTPLWRFLPQSRFRNPPNQSWRSFSTAIWFAARRKMSLACCYVLAHLRIATDGNTQQITSDGGRYHVAERALRSVFGEGDEVDAVTGRNWLDIGRDWRSYSRGGARTHSFNWAIMR